MCRAGRQGDGSGLQPRVARFDPGALFQSHGRFFQWEESRLMSD